jgi:tRNA(His) 5'-end guanylyltransferase
VNGDDIETRMRELEWFHALRVMPATWPIVRVDGRSFTRLSDERFERPFDWKFHEIMVGDRQCKRFALFVGELFALT